jgi:DNA-binding phage protein
VSKHRLGELSPIGDSAELAYFHHPMEDIDPPEVAMIPLDEAASAIRMILCEIIDADSKSFAALRCRVIAMSFGMIISQETMAQLARTYGLTRASISKQIRNRQNKAQIACTRINKRAGTSETYRMANIRRKKHEFDG